MTDDRNDGLEFPKSAWLWPFDPPGLAPSELQRQLKAAVIDAILAELRGDPILNQENDVKLFQEEFTSLHKVGCHEPMCFEFRFCPPDPTTKDESND